MNYTSQLFMENKGISGIVATVLMILISVSGVLIIYTVILPMFSDINSMDYSDVILGVSLEGFTVCDIKNKIIFVQVNRGGDQKELSGMEIIFEIEGNSLTYEINSEESVGPNEKKTYAFNISLGGYDDCPTRVKVVPIIIVRGRPVIGRITSEQKIPTGTISDQLISSKSNEANSRIPKDEGNFKCASNISCDDNDPCTENDKRICDLATGTLEECSGTPIGCETGKICQNGQCIIDCDPSMQEYLGECVYSLNSCGYSGWQENQKYVLSQDIQTLGSCFEIDEEGVTLDGAGHKISYSGASRFTITGFVAAPSIPDSSDLYGVYLNGNNITVRNISLNGNKGWDYGILAVKQNATLEYLNVSLSKTGIYLTGISSPVKLNNVNSCRNEYDLNCEWTNPSGSNNFFNNSRIQDCPNWNSPQNYQMCL